MRLNFEMTESQMEALKALQVRLGARDMKDLVNQALTLLEWAADEVSNGNEIAAVHRDDKTYRVLVMPLLKKVARDCQPQ
jgi:hypothetical protein